MNSATGKQIDGLAFRPATVWEVLDEISLRASWRGGNVYKLHPRDQETAASFLCWVLETRAAQDRSRDDSVGRLEGRLDIAFAQVRGEDAERALRHVEELRGEGAGVAEALIRALRRRLGKEE